MMEPVADNEHPPPGPPGGAQYPPPAGPPVPVPPEPGDELSVRPPAEPVPASPPPPPIDPEAVRQFQQFQQFQELLRQQQEQGFQQGTPPPPGFLQPWGPPPKRRPAWQRALRTIAGKLVTAAVVALLLAGVGYFAIDYFFGGPPEQAPAHEIGGGKAEDNLIFETNPRIAVQRIYDDIAQGDPTSACGRFTEEARAQFADHLHQFGGSCVDIVETIHADVEAARMKNEYANPDNLSAVAFTPESETVSVSSCELGVQGGPPLGMLTLGKIAKSEGGQWIVTRHEAETGACAQTPTTTPR
jgi:hypothetical protein